MNTLSKELEEFNFILQKHKWRIDSDNDILFSLITEHNTGIKFYNNGDSLFITDNTSSEVVGLKLPPNSDIPAKIIHAANGDIVLDAKQGDIVLRGMNIRIEGIDGLGGEVTINSSKTVQIGAPNVKVQSDGIITMTAASTISTAAGSNEKHGEIANEDTTGTDFLQASFFGKILTAIKKFKAFFNSICG
jgi:hypothetical protein